MPSSTREAATTPPERRLAHGRGDVRDGA